MPDIPITRLTDTVSQYTGSIVEARRLALLNEICRLANGNGVPFTNQQRQQIEGMLYGLETAVYEDMLVSCHRHDFRMMIVGSGVVRYCTDCSQLWKLYQNQWSLWNVNEVQGEQ